MSKESEIISKLILEDPSILDKYNLEELEQIYNKLMEDE